MAAFTSIALATLAAAAIGSGVSQGEASRRAGNRSRRDQEKAQKEAEASAYSQQRANDMAYAAANRKKPNINSLLANEQLDSSIGAASTILSKRRNPLAASSMLGG